MPGKRRYRGRRPLSYQPFLLLGIVLFSASVLLALLVRKPAPELLVEVPEELPGWIREDLLPVNEWSRPGTAMEAVRGVVVHYVGNPGTSAQQNRDYFANLSKTQETYASSNFIVGLDGEVVLCVPIGEVAYCSNGRNSDTLSIEVCHPDETGAFSDKTYESLVRLVRWLTDFYQLSPDDVIRHYDVTGKECPKYYVDHPEAWERFKQDLAAAPAAAEE